MNIKQNKHKDIRVKAYQNQSKDKEKKYWKQKEKNDTLHIEKQGYDQRLAFHQIPRKSEESGTFLK